MKRTAYGAKSEVRNLNGELRVQCSAFRILISSVVVALLLLACARKAMPPNPDRFPPHLAGIEARNQFRVDLVFDEPMQQKELSLSNFVVSGAAGDTLKLLAVSGGADAATLTLSTVRQIVEKYVVTGVAKDAAGNPTHFKRAFTGSARPDTIGPSLSSIQPRAFSTRQRRNLVLTLNFTKPIDTLTLTRLWILPSVLSSRFKPGWDPTLSAVRFTFADSLGPDTTVSVVVPPYVKDFSGNRLDHPGFTTFTSDTAALPKLVHGRLEHGDKPVPDGYVILSQEQPMLAAVSRDDGSFTLRARQEPYAVVALADTNRDGIADLSAFFASAALPDTLKMKLAADTTGKQVQDFFR